MTADEPDKARREALLKEYGEVVGNFRLLTDIRFKLLAFLPLAAGAAAAVLSAAQDRSGAAEAAGLALALFGLLVTLALATYNDRNDQLYNTLVGRAASIEWQLGLHDGAFANRPTAWFKIAVPLWPRQWPVNHRYPVALIYGSSVALWLFSVVAAGLQIAWGDDPAPRGLLAAAIVPAAVGSWAGVKAIRVQRKHREAQMREAAARAARMVIAHAGDIAALVDADEFDEFLSLCEELGGVDPGHARARARFYADLAPDEARRFMPDHPPALAAAHFVALISDVPAEWIDDCVRQRRRAAP